MKNEDYAHKFLHLNYDVVFEHWDGEIERHGYIHRDEAEYHFSCFDETDSDLYKRIYIQNLNTGEKEDEKIFSYSDHVYFSNVIYGHIPGIC